MNSFKIGGIEFGIGKFSAALKDGVFDVEIEGDEDVFDELCEDDDFKFDWAAYPPKIYIKGVSFDGGVLEINDELSQGHDIALYMMEHYDFSGKLTHENGVISIEGEADLDGEIESVSVRIESGI